METVVFLIFWFGGVPLAAIRISEDIAEERIFEGLLAWLDARYHGTIINDLLRCPLCISHWVIAGFALGFWHCWDQLPLPGISRLVAAVIGCFACIEITKRIRITPIEK